MANSLIRAYYLVKPFMPWRLRLALRRWRAKRRRKAFADVWPIDAKAGATPPGSPGWPEGKRFALVLTHDVEGTKGMSRVEQLVNLELTLGFRSCFNFVPEGEYLVPDAVREMLDRAGFEVGVHGLEHDGKLYRSEADFAAKAPRIMRYVRRWNASGFRSPLMQHNLAWLHALDVDYDGSTFDTDPFEPEPDGVGTIFPFWVPGPNGSGYVELPYTLVQDFTLFVVLREPNIDIWKRKLDWIAERGGMALIITHPDYMCFNGQPARDEFPVSHYQEFLRYVREKYDGSYWAAQPREVARYWHEAVPQGSRNTRRKIPELGETVRKNYLFFGGHNIQHGKGYVELLDALTLLKSRGIKTHTVICVGHGCNGLKEAKELADSKRVSDMVEWQEFYTKDELAKVYQASKVCVVPFTGGSARHPLTCAMVNATPVIAVRKADISEYLGDLGIYVDGSANSIADAICRIEEGAIDLTALGRNLRAKAMAELDYHKIAEELSGMSSKIGGNLQLAQINNRSLSGDEPVVDSADLPAAESRQRLPSPGAGRAAVEGEPCDKS